MPCSLVAHTPALPVLRVFSSQVSAELACAYPPGIPLLFPGEVVSQRALAELRKLKDAGCRISGPSDASLETLRVLC